jgi:hypothetical protein
MKLKVCGSITKNESLIKLKNNTLNHTCVAEAHMPYANYYGRVPENPQPNSLFLFTRRYYTLEEALRFTQNIEICEKNKVNTAAAFLQFKTHRYPAIRIRNFPDYEHLEMLQKCFMEQGVQFARKIDLEPEAVVTVNKCFFLQEKETGIYLDETEKHEGYIAISRQLNQEDFDTLVHNVWNNGNCRIFDGARGALIIDARVTEIIRVYSEHLDIEQLRCVKNEATKQMKSF